MPVTRPGSLRHLGPARQREESRTAHRQCGNEATSAVSCKRGISRSSLQRPVYEVKNKRRCKDNPKQLADFLEVPHQQFSTALQDWRVYHVKKMLLRFMVKQAAEKLKPAMSKSAATRSRAGMTLSIDNSVMDRCG